MGTKRNLSVADMCNDDVPFTPPATPDVKKLQLHKCTDSTGLAGAAIRTTARQAKSPVSKLAAGPIVQDPSGQINYHSHETDDGEIRKQHRRFNLHPENGVENYPSHVAFKSDKRGFQTQTGRSGFESEKLSISHQEYADDLPLVFEYTFRYTEPSSEESDNRSLSNDKEWRVVWDYNIGLVRIASLFKWQSKYQKTMPIKAIEATEGLLALCHSITGGKTDYQGFWVPFSAARAIAATFCFKIRYALTPMFGDDFVQLCLKPGHPFFQDYSISHDIVRQCAQQAEKWKRLAASYKVQPSLSLAKRALDLTADVILKPLNMTLLPNAHATQRLRKRRKLCRESEQAGKHAGKVAAGNMPILLDNDKDPKVNSPCVAEGQDARPPTRVSRDSETSMHDAAVILSYMADAEKVAVAKIMVDFRAGRFLTA